MTLDEQIKAMNARITDARASNDISLSQGRFSLEAMQAVSKVKLDWARMQIEWNNHVLEAVAKSIDNAKSMVELRMLQHAFRRFQMEEHRLVVKRRRAEIAVQRAYREFRWANMVFEGIHLKSKDLNKCWRSFGRLTMGSSVLFPVTDGTPFSPKTEATPEMTMYGLSQHCRRYKTTVKATCREFEFVREAMAEVSQRHIEGLKHYEAYMGDLESNLRALSEGQWAKAGVV